MKLLSKIILSLSIICYSICPVLAISQKEYDELKKIYNREIAESIIGGSGTVENPYILDYNNAPFFREFVENSWITQKNISNTQSEKEILDRSGFVGNCLTVYYGNPSNGVVWVYSYGGMSVTTDGNIRIKRAAYSSVEYTHKLAAAANYTGLWTIISGALSTYISNNQSVIATAVLNALTANGISTIGGCSASSVANSIARCVGAGATVYGYGLLAYSLLNNFANYSINSASQNNKTHVHIVYITAYQGSWYEYSVGEAGWNNDKVYFPDSTYGYGTPN